MLFRFTTGVVALIAAMVTSQALGAAKPFATREGRALKAIESLQRDIESATNAELRRAITNQIEEIRAAATNNGHPPIPSRIDAFVLPFTHYRYASARVGTGSRPAANLAWPEPEFSANPARLDLLDPLPSTFWIRPTNIAASQLAAGFGRVALPRYDDVIWDYDGPKKSYGGHAGFDARSGSRRIKVKFGETHSEPFTARIFHALGYNSDPTDYSPHIKIRYSPRLFEEFNSRRAVNTQLTLLGILPVWKIKFQPVHDPIDFIERAVLKNGKEIAGPELRAFLSNEDGRCERELDYLLTVKANIQPKVDDQETIGPWDFGQLDHEDRRELRGAGLLAAWLGWHDSRSDNTRLKLVRRGDRIELKHYFSDLGGGLGRATGLLSRTSEDVNGFADVFTRAPIDQGTHRMRIPFRIVNFRPIDRTTAFEEMTPDDARWMARMIMQISPEQIGAALRASGFTEKDTGILTTKLLSRRSRMWKDLGMGLATTKTCTTSSCE